MSPLQKKTTPFQSLEAVSALAFASHWIEAVPGFDQLAALHCPSPTFTEKHRDFPVRLGGITAFWGRISAGKGGGTSNCLGDLCTWNDAPQVFKKNKAGEDLQRQCLHETNVSDWLHSGFEQLWYKRLLNFWLKMIKELQWSVGFKLECSKSCRYQVDTFLM